ncbi:MAG: signal peptidase II [Flavobacteriales bacterium]|nr:signal peptidase II [Flavobacteriales bacterium]
MPNKLIKYILIFGVIALNVGCDQISKEIARERISSYDEIEVLGDYFVLIKAENTGAFLSLGSNFSETTHKIVLIILPSLFLLFGLYFILTTKKLTMLPTIAVSFMIGGGIGNIIDRIITGSVTDFMNMGIGSLRTGIFNFADVSIMVGLGLMILSSFLDRKNKDSNTEAATTA